MTEPTDSARPDRDPVEADAGRANTVEADTAERERDPADGERDADENGLPGGIRRKAGVEYKPL